MGSLKQHSILKGDSVGRPNEKVFVHKIFSQVAANNPNHTAIIFEGEFLSNFSKILLYNHLENFFTDELGKETTLTYRQLDARTNQLSRVLLKRCGTTDSLDSLVAVSMQPTDRLITLLLATLKAGMAYLPLDPGFPAPRVQHILQEAQPRLVVTEEGGRMRNSL